MVEESESNEEVSEVSNQSGTIRVTKPWSAKKSAQNERNDLEVRKISSLVVQPRDDCSLLSQAHRCFAKGMLHHLAHLPTVQLLNFDALKVLNALNATLSS